MLNRKVLFTTMISIGMISGIVSIVTPIVVSQNYKKQETDIKSSNFSLKVREFSNNLISKLPNDYQLLLEFKKAINFVSVNEIKNIARENGVNSKYLNKINNQTISFVKRTMDNLLDKKINNIKINQILNKNTIFLNLYSNSSKYQNFTFRTLQNCLENLNKCKNLIKDVSIGLLSAFSVVATVLYALAPLTLGATTAPAIILTTLNVALGITFDLANQNIQNSISNVQDNINRLNNNQSVSNPNEFLYNLRNLIDKIVNQLQESINKLWGWRGIGAVSSSINQLSNSVELNKIKTSINNAL